MDAAMRQMIDGLKEAMQAERTGHTFYAMAAMNTEDPTGKTVFEQLAREEMEHFTFLASHYRSLLEKGVPSDARLPSHPAVSSNSPIFSAALRDRIKDAHFEMSAISIAVQLELNAINHYREQAQKASLPEVKKLFEDLVTWETSHYEAFLHQQQSLQEDYWHGAGFDRF